MQLCASTFLNSALFGFTCTPGSRYVIASVNFFSFQAEDAIRDKLVTGVQTCALPISQQGGGRGQGGGAGGGGRRRRPGRLRALHRSEERRVGKEGRSRWSPYH